MAALLLTGLLLLLALGYYHLLVWLDKRRTRLPASEPAWFTRARHRFWLALYKHLAGRVRRIWRYCRRHFGFGIEILLDVQRMLTYLL